MCVNDYERAAEIEAAEIEAGDFEDTEDAPTEPTWPRYVNAYEVDRCYGGPEEGGWWYDRGLPLASIPCMTEEEITDARTRLERIYGPTYEGRRDRSSVIGEEQLEIYTEDAMAAFFPAERPHYE